MFVEKRSWAYVIARSSIDSIRSRSATASARPARVELGHLAAVALAERDGGRLRVVELALQARVVGTVVEIGEVPADLFRAGELRVVVMRRRLPKQATAGNGPSSRVAASS